MSSYLICSVEEYESTYRDIASTSINVSEHSPVFSPDGNSVLIAGIGSMSAEEVAQYKEDNGWNEE